MMQVESNALLDTFKRSWTLSSQESVQQWVDGLTEDDYDNSSQHSSTQSEGKATRPRLAEASASWQSLLSLPDADDGLALGAEAKSFLGLSDFMPISPRLSPLLDLSDAANDGCNGRNQTSAIETDFEEAVCPSSPSKATQPRPPLPVYPSIDSNDTFPSCVTTVSSLLSMLEPDPEDMLNNLGFADDSANIMARVPTRFFQTNSSVRGIDTQQFIDSVVEDEKDSSSFFTAEEESVSMILGRFRQNSIDIDFDALSCRSDGVHSGRCSSNPLIPDIHVEEVESLPGGYPWFKKLDTLPEENESVASPRGSFCTPDERPPLLRQPNICSTVEFGSRYSDEVFVRGDDDPTECGENSPEWDKVNYFDDDKRVTVKRDTSLNFTKLSIDKSDQSDPVRKLSSGSLPSRKPSRDLPSPSSQSLAGHRIVSQNSDASTVVPFMDGPLGNADGLGIGGIYQTSEELVNEVICGVPSSDDDDEQQQQPTSPSVLRHESARNFVSSPHSAFDDCLPRGRSRESSAGGDLDSGRVVSPTALHSTKPVSLPIAVPEALPSFADDTSLGIPSSCGRVLSSAYLEPTCQPRTEHARHAVQLQARRKASFSAKTCSIESSGFEDDPTDSVRLRPVKDASYRAASPSSFTSESCPLCGGPRSPGWGRTQSPGLASRLSDSDSRGLTACDHHRSTSSLVASDNHSHSSQRRYSQYICDQLSQLRGDLRRQESVNRLHLDERLEQMRCEILSEISQFVLTQFDAMSDTLKAKDAEILRLRKRLYSDGSPH